MSKIEWTIPNWQDESAYPKALDDWRWRWEFLRRSPKYRRAWLKYCQDGQQDARRVKAGKWFGRPTMQWMPDPNLSTFPRNPIFHRLTRKGIRKRRSLWRRYLRVLDAREAGETFEKIGKTLWMGQEKQFAAQAKQDHSRAVKLRDKTVIHF